MYSVNYLQVTVENTIELQEDHSVYDDHLLLKERTDRQWLRILAFALLYQHIR